MQLSSRARLLGVTADEFGRMTLRQLAALFRAEEDRQERQDARVALLGSLIINCAPHGEDFEPVQPHDLFPNLPRPRKSRERKKSNDEIIFGQLVALSSGAQLKK